MPKPNNVLERLLGRDTGEYWTAVGHQTVAYAKHRNAGIWDMPLHDAFVEFVKKTPTHLAMYIENDETREELVDIFLMRKRDEEAKRVSESAAVGCLEGVTVLPA